MPTDETQIDHGATTETGDKAGAEPADVVGLRKALAAERAARQAAAKEAADLKAAREAESAEAARKRGEFEALYNATAPKLTAAEERLAAYEAREKARTEAVTARNASRLAALPEPFRGLVPEGLDPDATTAQIERLEGIARAQTFPAGSGAGAGAGAGKKAAPPPECVAYARGLGKTTPEAVEAFYPTWLKTPAGMAWTAKQGGGGVTK